MRRISLIVAFGITLFFPGRAQTKPLSISPDGAFSLNGTSSSLSERFSRRLSGFEKQFEQLTDYPSSGAPPVVVVLHDENDNFQDRASLSVDSVEGSLPKIQVDFSPGELDSGAVSSTLAQAILLRQYYNGKSPTAGSRIVEFPEWLLHGLGKLSEPEATFAVIPASYLRGGTPPSIPDLLLQKAPSDSNTLLLDIYDTMTAELVSAGLKGDGGAREMKKWIGVFDPNSPKRPPSSWPPGWPMESVERRWLLLMAEKSGEDSGVVSMLSLEATIEGYDEILSEVSTPNHSLALLKKEKGALYLINQLSTRLIALRLRANPLSDSLLDESIQLCSNFKKFSEKKIAESEKKLLSLRAETVSRSQAIDSYLDWFEATKVPFKSGYFNSLLRTNDRQVQKGPIGHYLDTVEQRGW
jgi:hypothetical protein